MFYRIYVTLFYLSQQISFGNYCLFRNNAAILMKIGETMKLQNVSAKIQSLITSWDDKTFICWCFSQKPSFHWQSGILLLPAFMPQTIKIQRLKTSQFFIGFFLKDGFFFMTLWIGLLYLISIVAMSQSTTHNLTLLSPLWKTKLQQSAS